jgi:hypothetical protein
MDMTQSRMRLLLDRVNKRRQGWLVAVSISEEEDWYTEPDRVSCRWREIRETSDDVHLGQVRNRPLMKLNLLVY